MTNLSEPEHDPGPLPASLRMLRVMVTVLTGVMIVGVVVVVGLLVTRLRDRAPTLPENLTLPDGAQASAVTIGDTWYGVVTTDQRILIFDRLSGDLRQTITLK